MMKITGMKVNHKENPIGYDFPYLRFDWMTEEAEGKEAAWVRVEVREVSADGSTRQVYDSGQILPDAAGGHTADFQTAPETRYEWQVTVCTDTGKTVRSDPACFETAKAGAWTADWIKADPAVPSVRFAKGLYIEKEVFCARLYLCGLGLYEVYVDGEKAGDEYLMPGYHSYDLTQEYQTIDLTAALTKGAHDLSVMLGNGWYKGRFVFEGGFENLYGDCLKLIAELHITYADGSRQIIGTDDSWTAETTKIGANNIYDGEAQDGRLAAHPVSCTVDGGGKDLLCARTSMPIRAAGEIAPVRILSTPAGETVLDFGQMITGWVSVFVHERQDVRICLQYGEILQDGNFYHENLRTAKTEFIYLSDGEDKWVRPHFTYYGFRYVKLTGFSEVRIGDFKASRLISEIYPAGALSAGDGTLPDDADPRSGTITQRVNRLIANVRSSQMCNFLSIPTDCPQRDERMGWTGDIAIFADTACLNADCTGFLSHFMNLVAKEQSLLGGAVPLYVPRPKVDPATPDLNIMIALGGAGICVWGDSGVILPWRLYEHRRDARLLREQYPVMKGWCDYVARRVGENEKPHLWQNDLQLGDWLALDSGEDSLFGLTDSGYLASACYYYCLSLTRKAASVLGYAADEAAMAQEMEAVKAAFQAEFLAADGTVQGMAETQTAYALLLSFGLYRPGQEQKALERLVAMVEKKGNHLDTGFLGTAWFCQALSQFGAHETACKVFLQESYPGWLYEVNMGAVTTWEHWNSLDENGHVSSTGMNSMNHYAYGSIAAWMYRYLCGFTTCPDETRMLQIRPLVCADLGSMKGSYQAPWGTYEVSWKMISGTQAEYQVTVPFGGKARLMLPGMETQMLSAGTYTMRA